MKIFFCSWLTEVKTFFLHSKIHLLWSVHNQSFVSTDNEPPALLIFRAILRLCLYVALNLLLVQRSGLEQYLHLLQCVFKVTYTHTDTEQLATATNNTWTCLTINFTQHTSCTVSRVCPFMSC